MNSPGKNAVELTEITGLLRGNKCPHYKYDYVLQHLNKILASSLPNISFQEELIMEKLLLQVSLEGKLNPANVRLLCKGCNYAILIIEVLMNRKSLGSIVSTLCKTLKAGELIKH